MNNRSGRGGKLPLYQQIVRDIIREIALGNYAIGDRIPSENELAEKYHTSRITARKAIARLKEQGFLETYLGKGTYITQPDSTTYRISMAVRTPNRKLWASDVEFVQPPERVIHALAPEPGQRILRLTLKLQQDEPMVGCVYSYFIYHKGSKLVEEELKFIENSDFHGDETLTIRAVKAGAVGEILGLGPEDIILLLTTILRSRHSHRALLYREMYMDPRYYQIQGV